MAVNVIFFMILGLAALFDIKTRKIPNELFCIGIISGFLLFPQGMLGKVLGLLFVFGFGYLRLMGMGDIKLWMVIIMFTGFTLSCFIIAGAALLFILYSVCKNPAIVRDIHALFQHFILAHKIGNIDEKGMPFAPFILISALILKVVI